MKKYIFKNTIKSCIYVFLILIILQSIESLFIRMDETVLNENFINKVLGILILFVLLKILSFKWQDIGFKSQKAPKYISFGLLMGACFFLIAFAVEIIILSIMKSKPHLEIFVSGFSLSGDTVKRTGIIFFIMCIFFNLINVWMEEGVFRGLFIKTISTQHSLIKSLIVPALLFGIWHIVGPIRMFVDGDINFGGFLGLGIGYIILAGLMGVKWGLLYKITGNLWVGIADHFFNNCIATNLLHVVTTTGTDEMQIVRVLIAQLLSFIFVLVLYKHFNKKSKNIINT